MHSLFKRTTRCSSWTRRTPNDWTSGKLKYLCSRQQQARVQRNKSWWTLHSKRIWTTLLFNQKWWNCPKCVWASRHPWSIAFNASHRKLLRLTPTLHEKSRISGPKAMRAKSRERATSPIRPTVWILSQHNPGTTAVDAQEEAEWINQRHLRETQRLLPNNQSSIWEPNDFLTYSNRQNKLILLSKRKIVTISSP